MRRSVYHQPDSSLSSSHINNKHLPQSLHSLVTMDPPEKSTNEELSTQLQTSIQNKDLKLLEEILRKNKVVKDILVRCKRLRSHQTQVFGYHDDVVDAVQYAAYIGTLDALSALHRAGFRTEARAPTTRWTPLHFAAFGGHLEVVERLVSEGGDVNDCPSKHGATPLHLAIRYPPLVTFLLRQGARTDALCRVPAEHGLLKVNNFLTPLGVGVEAGAVGAVRALLEHGVDFDQVCEARNMDTPLKYTITAILNRDFHHEDHMAILDLLVTKSIEMRTAPKHKALLHALAPCSDPGVITQAVPRLIECGVKIEAKNRDRKTPLLEAIERCNSVCVKALIQENCCLRYTQRPGRTEECVQLVGGTTHPRRPAELCIYLSNVEAVKLNLYFGPGARPSLYVEVDLVGNIIHLVAIKEMLMLAGVGSGMGEGGVRDWSRAVDEACTKRTNYFNDQPFWREHTKFCVEVSGSARTLQDLCRVVLRETYKGRALVRYTRALRLPARLADFLQLKAELDDPRLLVNKTISGEV